MPLSRDNSVCDFLTTLTTFPRRLHSSAAARVHRLMPSRAPSWCDQRRRNVQVAPTPIRTPAMTTPQPPPKKALDIPEILKLFKTRREEYHRRPDVLVEARLADYSDIGPQNKLITWIIDHRGNLLAETEKEFTAGEIGKGIVILRYPRCIGSRPRKNQGARAAAGDKEAEEEEIYNEWYMTVESWEKQYLGMPVRRKFQPFQARGPTRKEGIKIDVRVIELLGGKDGVAVVQPPWGGTMYAVLGGLLTAEGSCIGPEVLRGYYERVSPSIISSK